ncbi:hypothetical protein LINPERHAP1_LOCUS17416, partial [Linum perenne]
RNLIPTSLFNQRKEVRPSVTLHAIPTLVPLKAILNPKNPKANNGFRWVPLTLSHLARTVSSPLVSPGFKEKLCQPWSNSVVVRLLGKFIGYTYLCHRLRSMWRPSGDMHIVDLDKSYFLVKFAVEQDYFKALTGGPWILLHHYLIVHQWAPSFRVSDELPKKMVAWVRFPHLPIHFYHGQVLTSLGNLIEKTIKIDFSTQKAERGKFTRIAMEIDLGSPLLPCVMLDGAVQQVEYENLSTLCFGCGRVGHEQVTCPDQPSLEATKISIPAPTSSSRSELDTVTGQAAVVADSYDPWMIASRKYHRSIKGNSTIKEGDSCHDGAEARKKTGNKMREGVIPMITPSSLTDTANFGGKEYCWRDGGE